MADRRLVLSEPLCFIVSKLGKVERKAIKSVALDFYRSEDIADAKNKLLSDANLLQLSDKLPHVPNRRDGDSRTARELDDIFTLIDFLDERKLLEALPKYVTDCPDNMPTVRLFEGDLSFIVKKMDQLEVGVGSLGSAVAAILKELRQVACTLSSTVASLSEWPALPSSKSAVVNIGNTLGGLPSGDQAMCQHSMTSAVTSVQPAVSDDPVFHSDTNWAVAAAATSTPQHCDRETTQQSDVNNIDVRTDTGNPFTLVRARKRQRQATDAAQQQHSQPESRSVDIPTKSVAGRRGRDLLVVGKAANTSQPGMLAAEQGRGYNPVEIAVFYVDNVSMQHSAPELRTFVSKMGVRVLS